MDGGVSTQTCVECSSLVILIAVARNSLPGDDVKNCLAGDDEKTVLIKFI